MAKNYLKKLFYKKVNILKIEDLRKDYDELQVKYGAKELDSIYNGGCEKNPDICFYESYRKKYCQ